MRFYASSDTTACTMRDAHSYAFSAKSRRLAAPAYGNPNRTVGYVDVDNCASCIADFQEPRHGFAVRLEDVPPTLEESNYLLGKATKQRTTIEALRAQLDELELQ